MHEVVKEKACDVLLYCPYPGNEQVLNLMNGEGDILPRMVDATPDNISPPFCKTYLNVQSVAGYAAASCASGGAAASPALYFLKAFQPS